MAPPKEVVDLVERFDRNIEAYRSGHYSEAQLRQEFLNPFFWALGWDVENRPGFAEAYKDVIHEDSVKIEGETKAPDYSFRIGETRKFFVEAKRPSVNLKEDPKPAFQLRRYAWTVRLPLSLLTNFAELSVYDCRVQPFQSDKASTARISYYTYKQYLGQWDELAERFSKDAVWKGSFDKFVESTRVKKGTAEVDEAFLKEIENWRKELASNIAARNPKLSQREVNFAVQRTIDRVIFLRICEDRGIEKYGQLRELQQESDVYLGLCTIFERADERYNSGLFHFHAEKDRSEPPDELTLRLKIDDAKLKAIFKQLYYPESSYEFSVLPADILGQVYEQFLGKVIHLTAGHFARVEDKPEVKKAGGVYYTPTYIVDYIVKNTLGKRLEGKTPKQAAKLRILDPARGSGSFLIAAYQYLLNWHRDRYLEEGAEKHRKELYQSSGGTWRLTISEKKRILRNNLYGVDIDPQAVEVTKLSLLLKVLEGESEQTLNTTYRMFHERALPDLGDNIKCGNSLIGWDAGGASQMSLIDGTEEARVNAFNWGREFREILTAGGFDAVVGNPPYIGFHGFMADKEYLKATFISAKGKFDYYLPFIERGLMLLKKSGLLGMICPTNFMKRGHGQALREHIQKSTKIAQICDFEDVQVFRGALNYTGVFILEKSLPNANSALTYKRRSLDAPAMPVLQVSLADGPWVFRDQQASNVLSKIRAIAPSRLGEITRGISEGIVTGQNDVFLLSRRDARKLKLEADVIRPCLRGSQIRRYALEPIEEVVMYPYRAANGRTQCIPQREMRTYPRVWSYLESRRKDLLGRPYFQASSKAWYELWCQRDISLLASRKIVVPEVAESSRFAVADESEFYGDTVCGITFLETAGEDLLFFLGVLNSKLIDFYYKQSTVPKANRFFIYKTMFLKNIPIRRIDFNDQGELAGHDGLVRQVARIVGLHQDLAGARTDQDKIARQRQIEATDRQIDRLVYELYGLTAKEIAIVEGSAQAATASA